VFDLRNKTKGKKKIRSEEKTITRRIQNTTSTQVAGTNQISPRKPVKNQETKKKKYKLWPPQINNQLTNKKKTKYGQVLTKTGIIFCVAAQSSRKKRFKTPLLSVTSPQDHRTETQIIKKRTEVSQFKQKESKSNTTSKNFF